jgi:hypothetical protein
MRHSISANGSSDAGGTNAVNGADTHSKLHHRRMCCGIVFALLLVLIVVLVPVLVLHYRHSDSAVEDTGLIEGGSDSGTAPVSSLSNA